MRRAALLALLLGSGCAGADEVDVELSFETHPLCTAADTSCLNAGTETLVAEGIPVIYKRLPGHPLVALQVAFDARIDSSRQGWAESFALDLVERRGSTR